MTKCWSIVPGLWRESNSQATIPIGPIGPIGACVKLAGRRFPITLMKRNYRSRNVAHAELTHPHPPAFAFPALIA